MLGVQNLEKILQERIVILDGAMGTRLQAEQLSEADFRGERFATHANQLDGCNDVLCLTQPDLIRAVHGEYLRAGADIIETNTFNATPLGFFEYGLGEHVYEVNHTAAGLAREAIERNRAAGVPGSAECWVAGSIGPTNKTASMSPDVEDPGARAVDFDILAAGYREQARGLLDGGVDLLLVETIFDTLNAKAAVFAIESLFLERECRVPLMLSLTVTDRSGRTLTGQTIEAFHIAMAHAVPVSVGINCAFGAAKMRPHVEELSGLVSCFTSCCPNAGLPNELGEYDEGPDELAGVLGEYADAGYLNIVGGCCGTTPAHIEAIAARMRGIVPRRLPEVSLQPTFSGLEALVIRENSNFTLVGERTNVTGSRRFARLIRSGDYEAAVSVAAQQVAGGANIIDVNVDEGLLDSVVVIRDFLNRLLAEPEIAKLPIMVDSSDFDVVCAGLKCLQGKGIANSLSLKQGEAEFVERARLVKRLGAAVLVMAFDEQGQATTAARRLEILGRAYRILVDGVGFSPVDIIFDPNVLAIATGLPEHAEYGASFIAAARELKRDFPAALISGGISNLSFAFRGNEPVRQAMNAVFLYHGIAAGLDMGIVNAGQLALYDDVDAELRDCIEDCLFARCDDATERLTILASTRSGAGDSSVVAVEVAGWRTAPVDERLAHAVVQGELEYWIEDLSEVMGASRSALSVVEGPLMAGMREVGRRFGDGKMFLPQVVKSARAMKRAVSILSPQIEAESGASGDGVGASRGRVLLATVRGDVHDIGKGIVAVVLSCNGFDVIDLGVMVPAEEILEAACREQVDIIGLSGLITPSLVEMVHIATEMSRLGLSMPLMVGGATTSAKHTAVKIAPALTSIEGGVFHAQDAADGARLVSEILAMTGDTVVTKVFSDNAQGQTALRELHAGNRQSENLLSYDEAIRRRLVVDFGDVVGPTKPGVVLDVRYSLAELRDFIDWTPFFHAWELRGVYPQILSHKKTGEQARDLFAGAQALLDELGDTLFARAVWGVFPANAETDQVVFYSDAGRTQETARLSCLRQQKVRAEKPTLSLCDFVAPVGGGADYVGAFVVTAGLGVDELAARYSANGDEYSVIMLKVLADRLAEAAAEYLHLLVRRDCAVADASEGGGKLLKGLLRGGFRGTRPAPGYAACPDHFDKRLIFDLLSARERIGVDLTSSVGGFLFFHPEARYFSIGPICRDQVSLIAARQGISVAELERRIAPNLGYDT